MLLLMRMNEKLAPWWLQECVFRWLWKKSSEGRRRLLRVQITSGSPVKRTMLLFIEEVRWLRPLWNMILKREISAPGCYTWGPLVRQLMLGRSIYSLQPKKLLLRDAGSIVICFELFCAAMTSVVTSVNCCVCFASFIHLVS